MKFYKISFLFLLAACESVVENQNVEVAAPVSNARTNAYIRNVVSSPVEVADAATETVTTPTCIPTPEVCDGKDNDCNGRIDDANNEDKGACACALKFVDQIGQPCSGNYGACAENGVLECQTKWGNTSCSTDVGGSESKVSQELCDGIDNDCDGQTDEDYASELGKDCNTMNFDDPSKGSGSWTCGIETGKVVCDASIVSQLTCTTADASHPTWFVVPKMNADACDGVDNDCDGVTDNGCPSESKGDQVAIVYDGPGSKEGAGHMISYQKFSNESEIGSSKNAFFTVFDAYTNTFLITLDKDTAGIIFQVFDSYASGNALVCNVNGSTATLTPPKVFVIKAGVWIDVTAKLTTLSSPNGIDCVALLKL